MDPEREVSADTAKSRRRVEVSAGQIQAIARPEDGFEHRRFLGLPLHRGFPVVPGLITEWRLQDGGMNPPLLLSFDLSTKTSCTS